MHGSLESIATYVAQLRVPAGLDVVLFPPAVYLAPMLAQLAEAKVGVSCGSQDVGEFDDGAHTGEIAAGMVKDVGALWTLVGHSERRQDQAESDELAARKVVAALEAGLKPILCVGETLGERTEGREMQVVTRQLDAITERCGMEFLQSGAVAYEPIWAIGTGRTATPAQAQDMHSFIRGHLGGFDHEAAMAVRILYGGSVKPENAERLFRKQDIDGGLVGGASLDAGQFSEIIAAANARD